MRLNKEEVELFYKLNWSLLFYTNQRYPVIKNLNSPSLKGQEIEKVAKLHEKVYSHPELIDSFIAENPFKFNEKELNIIKSWKNFIKDEFFIILHTKDHTIFLKPDKEPEVYGVIGLYDELEDIFPYLPLYVETTLLPFNDKIIYSGIFCPYNISFGGGMRRTIQLDYQKAKSKFGVITSLEKPITQRKESEEELLRFYVGNEKNRMEYEDEINKILKNNPSLLKVYYQEIGRANARKIRKRFSELGVANGWFAVLNDIVIVSGKSEDEVKKQIKDIIPEEKQDYVYLFKYAK